MSPTNIYSIRIVKQHIRTNQRFSYRLLAYGGDHTFRPAEFASLDSLLDALRSVIPDFDERSLSMRKDGVETYLAFSGEMELDDSQLSLLSLKSGIKS